MRSIFRVLGVIAFAMTLALMVVFAAFVFKSGLLTTLEPHFAGTCRSVDTGGQPVADIDIDSATGIAYFAAGDTVKQINLKAETWTAEPALASALTDFSPQEISLFTGQSGIKRLFVVNRPTGKRGSIEIFDLGAEGKWTHIGSLRDTHLTDPRALVGAGPQQFYLANASNPHDWFGRFVELVLSRGKSQLTYYNGERMLPAIVDMIAAGGVAMSPDGHWLYVAETSARQIQAYKRDPFLGALTPAHAISIPGGPGRITMAADGSLWVASQPKTFALLGLKTTDDASPTQAVHIENPESDRPKVSEVYLAASDQFPSGQVAAVYNDQMLMGSPRVSHLQVCTLPGAPH